MSVFHYRALALVVAMTVALGALPSTASADPLTLEQARKAAMQNYAGVLAAAVKDNACHWEAGPAYHPVAHDSPAWAYLRCMFSGSHMSRDLRHCLVAASITTAGVLVGGVIAAIPARAIAGGIVGGGAASCAQQLAL
jgi:hypothetical protein